MTWQPPSTPPPGYAPPGGYPPYPAYPSAGYGAGSTPWGPAPGLAYAGFWRRVGGYLIDDLIFAVPAVILFLVIFGSTISPWFTAVSNAAQNNQPAPQLVLPTGGLIAFAVFDAAFSVLYFGVLVSGWGSTVGQRAVGVRVVCQEDSAKSLPVGRAVLRAIVWWGAALCSFVVGLSTIVELAVLLAVLWVAWDPRKQGLHDKLGGALVVRTTVLFPVAPFGQLGSPYGYPPPASPDPTWYPPGPPAAP
jgi:uncharacterized RDD family membrane protein YckC